jgi:hypothetical protein
MLNLVRLLTQEPAAFGSLLASLLPALVLIGAVHLDDKAIAALVVAVNSLVSFSVRMAVSPTGETVLPSRLSGGAR